jgi:hypothetical protein
VTDVEGDGLSYAWTYAGGGVDAGATCSFADATAVDTTIKCTDDGTFTATLRATDAHGAWSEDSAIVTVSNAAPAVTIITPNISSEPVPIGTAVSVNSSFTDAGVNDTHTCSINWGNGTTTAGIVTETPQSGAGTCTGSSPYASAGVYTITVTVTDDDGGWGSAQAMQVAYDPNGGFVTGGGWVDSPIGAYSADPTLVGRASFGFVSKYEKGAKIPTGQTEFQFKAGNLNFHSTKYEWLVVSGSRAQYKGTGTINGGGTFGFLLTVTDGQRTGGGGIDRFRIKITDGSAIPVYDNQPGETDDAAVTTTLGGGSIVIHEAAKK